MKYYVVPIRIIAGLTILFACGQSARAQTSYPMLMTTRPIAVQAGQASEVSVLSRYNLHGSSTVLISGTGITGEVIPPEQKEGEAPKNIENLKVRFTTAADALPGVRDYRLQTPRGASTVGQMVVVRDPVFLESGDNNTLDKGQPVTLPVAVCGSIEAAEDVDFFKFNVTAGTTLTFHVLSQRLQDRIHDLQVHVDPILFLRNAKGGTLASSDNYFYADPLLTYTFEQEGEYVLEIRDVRYQGNTFWDYCIEINDRPFAVNAFPLGVTAAKETELSLFGPRYTPESISKFTFPAETSPGNRFVQLPFGDGLTNSVSLYVTDLPIVQEIAEENNAPAQGQIITLPTGINGRISTEADVDTFAFEAKQGEQWIFEVIARRCQSNLDSNLRVLRFEDGVSLFEIDDLNDFKMSNADSMIDTWVVPADGKYAVEIRDLHLRGGNDYPYFIKVTKAQPTLQIYADTDKTQISPGSCGVFYVHAIRKYGFAGDVQLQVDGLPEGVTAYCGKIPANRRDGCVVLEAAANAPFGAANIDISGIGIHTDAAGAQTMLNDAATIYQEVYSPGGGRAHWPVDVHTVSVGEPNDIRAVKLNVYEVTLKPGQSQRIDIHVERAPEFKQNITLDVLFEHLSIFADPLPEGVTVDGKNSKKLLSGTETDGYITLTASDKAAPVEKIQIAVLAHVSINFVMKTTYSSQPVFVTVAPP
ncbi:MAG: PPC domain-containing protein [Planctomycetaceae bacterium]